MRSVLVACIVGIPILIYLAPQFAAFLYTTIVFLMPLWLPVLLALIAWPLWLVQVRSQFVSRIEYETLELKPGDQTPKSAKSMELVFYSLYHRIEPTRLATFLMGTVRVPWCFEVAASRGIVRFYIHIPTHQRAAVEARIRAEYRDIDIDEVRDYSRERHYHPTSTQLAMREYRLEKPDPYPLRSYEYYESGKDRRDVFEEMLEDLSTMGDGEELWLSFMIRPHQRDWGNGMWEILEMPKDTLHIDATRQVQKLVGVGGVLRELSSARQELVAGIEAALKKPSFDCGIRALYIAERTQFSDERAASLDHMFDRFGDPEMNNLVAYDPLDRILWPVSDVLHALPALKYEYLLKLYRRRAYFAPPYYGAVSIFNAEELATLWHIPKVSRASALSRSRGRKLEPPANLPI
mgnify:CR=1 FL=1